jgi:hypothetical protein
MVTDGGAVKNLDKPIEKQICTISHYPHPFIPSPGNGGGEIYRKTGCTGVLHPVHPVFRDLSYQRLEEDEIFGSG